MGLNITSSEQLAQSANNTVKTNTTKVVIKQLPIDKKIAIQGNKSKTKLTFFAEY